VQILLQHCEFRGISRKGFISVVVHLRVISLQGTPGLEMVGGESEDNWGAYLWSVKEKHQLEFEH